MLSIKPSFLAAAAILLRIAAAGSFDCEAAFSNCLEMNTCAALLFSRSFTPPPKRELFF